MAYQWAQNGYVRISLYGPVLLGNRQFKFTVKYWSSSSGVWNGDGQDIKIRYESSAGAGDVTLGTLWGSSLGSYTSEAGGWTANYTYTAPAGVTVFNIYAKTQDRMGDNNFYTMTSHIQTIMCDATAPTITSTTATSCTLSTNVKNPYDEELKYQDAQGNYHVVNLAASNSSRAVSFTVNNMPKNSAYTDRRFGMILPNGASNSVYVWGEGTYKIRTSFSEMSMPTIKASRDSNDPTTINVSWGAGGTTNKPTGNASRVQYIVAIECDDNGTLNSNNIKWGSTINLEAAGSGTITGVDVNKRWCVYAEYRVDNLGASSSDRYFQKSNILYIERMQFNPYIKVGGTYKKCTDGYIKVGGSYKKIEKAYLKVNGSYKEIQ